MLPRAPPTDGQRKSNQQQLELNQQQSDWGQDRHSRTSLESESLRLERNLILGDAVRMRQTNHDLAHGGYDGLEGLLEAATAITGKHNGEQHQPDSGLNNLPHPNSGGPRNSRQAAAHEKQGSTGK